MKQSEFKRWLARQGATFTEGTRHTKIRLKGRQSVMPRHPGAELGDVTRKLILKQTRHQMNAALWRLHPATKPGNHETMFKYPARLIPDGTGFAVKYRDIPEAITCGKTREEAIDMAVDALVTAMDFYFEDKRAVPMPSPPKRGDVLIELPASVAAKVLLLNAMVAQQVTPAELARRLNTRRQDVNRVIDLAHATKIDTIAAALAALGMQLEISATPA